MAKHGSTSISPFLFLFWFWFVKYVSESVQSKTLWPLSSCVTLLMFCDLGSHWCCRKRSAKRAPSAAGKLAHTSLVCLLPFVPDNENMPTKTCGFVISEGSCGDVISKMPRVVAGLSVASFVTCNRLVLSGTYTSPCSQASAAWPCLSPAHITLDNYWSNVDHCWCLCPSE